MHPTTQRLFDEHAKPTHAATVVTTADAAFILDLAARVQAQGTVYRRLLLAIETDPNPDPAFAGQTERFHQTFGHLNTAADELITAGRKFVNAGAQLDRYMAQMRALTGTQGADLALPVALVANA